MAEALHEPPNSLASKKYPFIEVRTNSVNLCSLVIKQCASAVGLDFPINEELYTSDISILMLQKES